MGPPSRKSAGRALVRVERFQPHQSPAERLLQAFLSNRSKLTLKAYKDSLEQFAVFMGREGTGGAAEALLSPFAARSGARCS